MKSRKTAQKICHGALRHGDRSWSARHDGCMTRQPNILILWTDQQRADTLGVLNSTIDTPNLDRLAGCSTMFTRAFCTQPVCTPARASLMTGRWPHQHGTWLNNSILPMSCHVFQNCCEVFTTIRQPISVNGISVWNCLPSMASIAGKAVRMITSAGFPKGMTGLSAHRIIISWRIRATRLTSGDGSIVSSADSYRKPTASQPGSPTVPAPFSMR